jgi:uncharacterized OsmC-like protein
MTTTTEIAQAMDLALRYLRRHPAPMADTSVTATLESGLRTRATTADGWSVATDMPTEVGGSASAPTAGTLLRAALASCDATTLAMCAAEAGIELTRAEVSVESTSDYRGLLGVDGVSPGPLDIVVRYQVAAPGVDAERLHELVQTTEDRSPVAAALRAVIPMRTEIELDLAG